MAKPEPAPALVDNDVFLKALADCAGQEKLKTSQAIFNTEGLKLLDGGRSVDPDLYDRLVSHRLALPIDECIEAANTVTAASLVDAAEAAMKRWPFFAKLAEAPASRSMLFEALASVPLSKPLALQLTIARSGRPALFQHGAMMGMLCAWLVREGHGKLQDMSLAAAAGVLHDIGMLHIDPALLEPGNLLSGDQLNPLYVHPTISAMVLGRFWQYPKDVLRAVVEHHECLDGSGYPRALTGEAISPLGRVLGIAEVVTAMFDGERQYPEQRISLLLRINPRRYDPALVASVHRVLRELPPPAEGAGVSAVESVENLRKLDALLTGWRIVANEMMPRLTVSERAMVKPVNEQTETLQRMLYEAGITPDQLGMVADGAADDAGLRVELWALGQELQWQLRATANQLQRRWRAVDPKMSFPAALAGWLEQVKALGGESRG